MGNEWDTGLYKEIKILATEAVTKWGQKLYERSIFNKYKNEVITVRVKEQKVTLKFDDATSCWISVEVEFNNNIYNGIYFKKIAEGWIYRELSRINIKGTPENHYRGK